MLSPWTITNSHLSYAQTFARPSGPIIWNFLNEERTIGKMEAASFFSWPSVEPLASDLLGLYFPEEILAPRFLTTPAVE